MGLKEQLTIINRGSQPVTDYLAKIRGLADELSLIGSPVGNDDLVIYSLNGIGPEFKEITAAVRARDTVISFEELHDKLVEYDSFLKREEARSINNSPSMTVNSTQVLIHKNGNQ